MTEIICILDRSGSMITKESDVLGGLKQFIQEQKDQGEANLLVIKFNHNVENAYEGKLSGYVPPKKWDSMGMTALLDALGYAFTHTKERFEQEKPEKVIVAVFTDGLENASQEYTKEQIKNLIQEHENKYGWTFIYFGPSAEARAEAISIGFNQANTIIYDEAQTKAAFRNFSDIVTQYRSA